MLSEFSSSSEESDDDEEEYDNFRNRAISHHSSNDSIGVYGRRHLHSRGDYSNHHGRASRKLLKRKPFP